MRLASLDVDFLVICSVTATSEGACLVMRGKDWSLSTSVRQAAHRPAHAAAGSIAVAACLAACCLAPTQVAASSATGLSSRCATFRAKNVEYGVYVGRGHVKCGVAKIILKAIVNGKGKYVNNGFSYNSYTLYGGWLCPSGNMGEQTCEHSKHPVSKPQQDIVSLSCSFGSGCPKQAAVSNE